MILDMRGLSYLDALEGRKDALSHSNEINEDIEVFVNAKSLRSARPYKGLLKNDLHVRQACRDAVDYYSLEMTQKFHATDIIL